MMEERQPFEVNGSGIEPDVGKWGRIEITFESEKTVDNPFQDVSLQLMFTSPTEVIHNVHGFWDGGQTWRARFSPNEQGEWTYMSFCSDIQDSGLHNREGAFLCGPTDGYTAFDLHGPVQVSGDNRHFVHADGTPFFWMADTAWNGALRSTGDEWQFYLSERVRQQFTAVQWVATQWRSAPNGDLEGRSAFSGSERIRVQPDFFRRIDEKVEAVFQAGLLSAPVLLWASGGGDHPKLNPGYGLPVDQAILLTQYMVARWSAYSVVWLLAGDGDYAGEGADRWKQIGKAVFGSGGLTPVAMHCRGRQWVGDEFRSEKWMNVLGYQSGHGDNEETLSWLTSGPPATGWRDTPTMFSINFEPAYENHVAYHSKNPHDAYSVRTALYWSLLNAPTAGVTYGGHGVWGWDDGSGPPVDHPKSGTPLPWHEALVMEGSEQIAHLMTIFGAIDWWRLSPDPELLAEQPGDEDVHAHLMASRSRAGDLAVIYTPSRNTVKVRTDRLQKRLTGLWYDPRTGDPVSSSPVGEEAICTFEAPGDGDWVLILA